MNKGRRNPSLCLFRKRYLYCFGGAILRFKDDDISVEVETKKELPKTKLEDAVIKEADEEEDKSGSDEESDDVLEASMAESDDSDLDIVDLDKEEEEYELDFSEHYITQIECFDMQG